jgi:anti-sigma regulatory factor (Ser/Thr protein kinase)
VKLLAGTLGFASLACNELAIVTSELASNILKYGVRGSVAADPLDDPGASGILIVARDFGPPFRDLAMALQDGCDDRGPIDPIRMLHRRGIGGGLGAIVRLTHSFRVNPLDDGKAIEVRRYVNRRLGNPSIVLS